MTDGEQTLSFELFTIGKTMKIMDAMLEETAINSEVFANHIGDALCVGIRTWMMKTPHPARKVTLSAPADWWEAFKDRWFPNFLLQRFPVKYGVGTEYEYGPIFVCPHANFKFRDHSDAHLSFLKNMAGEP